MGRIVSDVTDVVEGLDLVVALAEGHLGEEDLRRADQAARQVRHQVAHLGSTLVVALLGGTGTGKSSLLNALANERIAAVGVIRPQTTEPLAWIPVEAEPALEELLDSLAIERRVTQRSLPGVAILDLTDIDSLTKHHRRRVEGLLPDIDVEVWVLDPVKYADIGMHRDLIAPYDGSGRLLFVLNKIDTLSPEERPLLRRHLVDLLEGEGITSPALFEVAADPPVGPTVGVDLLLSHLATRLDDKRISLGKLLGQARAAAHLVGAAAGVLQGGSLDFEERWDRLHRQVVDSLTPGGPAPLREEALRSVEHFVADLSGAAGGRLGERLRHLLPPEAIETRLQAALAAAEHHAAQVAGSGRRARASAERAFTDSLDAEIGAGFGAPLRELLWERATLAAALASLMVDVESAAARLTRPSVAEGRPVTGDG